MMKRRDALKAMGGIAGAATLGQVLPGCGGGDDGPVGIHNLVFMMLENRSYDHVFGARTLLEGKPGDGLVAGMKNTNTAGADIGIFEVGARDAVCVADPPHSWDPCRTQVNGGAMDGFVRAYEDALQMQGVDQVMAYQTRAHQPASWALADAYTTCDRWFCSVLGPTWPNRMYWHSGTSQGLQNNDRPPQGFSWQTIYHQLIGKGVEYRYYYGNFPTLSLIPDIPTLEYNFFMEDFFADAEAGKLKPVTYIDPAFLMNDDHPPIHTMLGQQLIASVYAALANSPQWKNTLLVITYDEHGGYYDHVAPPDDAVDDFASTGFNQLGVRVPAIVVGPYVKAGAVVSTRYDHTSPLKHIQNMFGLDPLTLRSDAASDLTDCIDAERLAAGDWAQPAEIPAVEVNESDITDACSGGQLRETHPVLEWADRYPEYGRLERRGAALRDYVFAIGDVLERYNAGRIIRGK